MDDKDNHIKQHKFCPKPNCGGILFWEGIKRKDGKVFRFYRCSQCDHEGDEEMIGKDTFA